jgi:hypothetical protein
MILFVVGALMLAAGVGVIFYVRSPEDSKQERAHIVSLPHTLLSNAVLVLILTGGTLMALAIF